MTRSNSITKKFVIIILTFFFYLILLTPALFAFEQTITVPAESSRGIELDFRKGNYIVKIEGGAAALFYPINPNYRWLIGVAIGTNMEGGQDYAEICLNAKFKRPLSKPPIEYYRMFYADTALYGATPSLMCGYAFFGPDHLLFGTDMPYDCENGARYTRQTIAAIEKMEITKSDKAQIYNYNAMRLLKLDS